MEHKKNSYTDQQNALLARNEGWIIHDAKIPFAPVNINQEGEIMLRSGGVSPLNCGDTWGECGGFTIIAYRLTTDDKNIIDINIQDHENDTPCTKDGTESDGCTDGEWSGEGLPPVGVECLMWDGHKDTRITMTYIGDGVGCYKVSDGNEFTIAFSSVTFNPFQTPKQKTVAAAYELIKDCSSTMEMLDSLHDFGFLYDSAEKNNV